MNFSMLRYFVRRIWIGLMITLPVLASAGPASAQSVYSNPTAATTTDAPTLSPRQKEIMRTVRAGDGYITEALHREFWAAMPFPENQTARVARIVEDLAEKALGPSQSLGYETWLSARLSLQAGKVVRSPGLNSAMAAMIGASEIDGYHKAARQSVQSVDRILTAAADGTPLETANGPIFINDDLISATLAGIEGGARRFEILVRPRWNAPLQNYSYPALHVSTLSPWAFVPETSEITIPGGRKGMLRSVSRTISETQTVYISFADYKIDGSDSQKLFWPDPQGTTIRNVQASLRAVGAKGPTPHGVTWRGLISSTGSGSAADADGSIHVTIRNVYLPNHSGFLTLIAASEVSLFDSQQLFDQLEAQTQVLK